MTTEIDEASRSANFYRALEFHFFHLQEIDRNCGGNCGGNCVEELWQDASTCCKTAVCTSFVPPPVALFTAPSRHSGSFCLTRHEFSVSWQKFQENSPQINGNCVFVCFV